jgi:PAS domain S-box-containing protein
MNYIHLSLLENAPPGFVFKPSLSKRDVRSGPFALYSPSVEKAESLLKKLEGPLVGIIVTDSDEFLWDQREFPLVHLGVPPPLRPHLPVLLLSYLGLLEAAQRGADESMKLSLEHARATEDRRRLAQDFARSRENLLEEISEREKIEEDQKIFSSLVENSNDLIGIASFDGTLMYLNRTGKKLMGLENVADIRTINLRELVFPKHQPLLDVLYANLHTTGHWKGEAKFRHFQSGESVYFETHAFVIRDMKTDQPIAFAKISRDIGERRAMERERIQIQKLESVGILAGGIAHDFNNLLSAIAGYISLVQMQVPLEEEAGRNLAKAEKATFRAKDLTRQLLTFSKGGSPVKKATPIGELLRESAGWAFQGSNVQCDIDAPPDLWLVDVDEGQISQVLNNLLINACQAMPRGGTIRISARNTRVGFHEHHSLEEGNYVKVSIKDHGIGIPGEHLPKIFDPYFTTKQHGSGLGLATSYAIINKHRGNIAVESKLGHGTTFHLFIPEAGEKKPEQAPPRAVPLNGEGRILVMDDDETLRDVASSILQSLGYTTRTAKDGKEAVACYEAARKTGEPFDAVIMDLTVPGGTGGKEAVGMLLQIDPGAKVIVTSGYSNDDCIANYKAYGFSGVVPKPYNLKQLGEEIGKLVPGPCSREPGKSAVESRS